MSSCGTLLNRNDLAACVLEYTGSVRGRATPMYLTSYGHAPTIGSRAEIPLLCIYQGRQMCTRPLAQSAPAERRAADPPHASQVVKWCKCFMKAPRVTLQLPKVWYNLILRSWSFNLLLGLVDQAARSGYPLLGFAIWSGFGAPFNLVILSG